MAARYFVIATGGLEFDISKQDWDRLMDKVRRNRNEMFLREINSNLMLYQGHIIGFRREGVEEIDVAPKSPGRIDAPPPVTEKKGPLPEEATSTTELSPDIVTLEMVKETTEACGDSGVRLAAKMDYRPNYMEKVMSGFTPLSLAFREKFIEVYGDKIVVPASTSQVQVTEE